MKIYTARYQELNQGPTKLYVIIAESRDVATGLALELHKNSKPNELTIENHDIEEAKIIGLN